MPNADDHANRSVSWKATFFVAVALVAAGCGGDPAANTTEPLLPIAQASPTEPAGTPVTSAPQETGLSETQLEIIDRLLAAYDSGDPRSVLALWGAEGDHYRPDIEFDLTIGGRWSNVACDLDSTGRPRCDLMYTNDLLATLDAPPLEGFIRIEMTDDGKIASWDYDTGNRATTAAYLRPFSDWVLDTDPSAADEMFDWNGFAFRHPEAQAIWATKVAEYLEQFD